MAKKITKKIKLQIQAAKATPAPPLGPALGQAGINIGDFVTKFNAATAKMATLILWLAIIPPAKALIDRPTVILLLVVSYSCYNHATVLQPLTSPTISTRQMRTDARPPPL